MDVIAVWQEQVEALTEEQAKTFRTSRFMYEVHHFLDMEKSDHIGWSLLFMEAVRNCVNQVYPLTRKMVLDLAALQLQEELGDFTGDADERMLNGNLHRYIPARFLTEDERPSMIAPLVKRWKRLQGQGYDQFECQLTYVEILKQSIWYVDEFWEGAFFFNLKFFSFLTLFFLQVRHKVVQSETYDGK